MYRIQAEFQNVVAKVLLALAQGTNPLRSSQQPGTTLDRKGNRNRVINTEFDKVFCDISNVCIHGNKSE